MAVPRSVSSPNNDASAAVLGRRNAHRLQLAHLTRRQPEMALRTSFRKHLGLEEVPGRGRRSESSLQRGPFLFGCLRQFRKFSRRTARLDCLQVGPNEFRIRADFLYLWPKLDKASPPWQH